MTANSMCKFVVFTTNRSGSTWLMSTLGSYPHVAAHGELFLPRVRATEGSWDAEFSGPRYVETPFAGRAVRPFSVFSYLADLYGAPGAVGFKLMYAQLGQYPEIMAYFVRHRVRVVHLVRRNHLDVLLSYAVKAKIGQAHLLAGQTAPDDLRVELDTSNLMRQITKLQRKQNAARMTLKLSGLPHQEVSYEELVLDSTRFRPLLDFLSIENGAPAPRSTMTKIRKGTHRDVIRNYDEVKRLLAHSKFAGLLE